MQKAGFTLIELFVVIAITAIFAAERGVKCAKQETLENGVQKVTYIDPDGNEVEFSGAPLKL